MGIRTPGTPHRVRSGYSRTFGYCEDEKLDQLRSRMTSRPYLAARAGWTLGDHPLVGEARE